MARNLWCKIETRMVKNVCAPAAVINDKIYIVGGSFLSQYLYSSVLYVNI